MCRNVCSAVHFFLSFPSNQREVIDAFSTTEFLNHQSR
ncbi:unnamed protein product [Victoria cruziana]